MENPGNAAGPLVSDERLQGRVAIFRHNLFVDSETFIRAQARALTRYEPLFVARRPIHDAPSHVRAVTMAQGSGRFDDVKYAMTAASPHLTRLFRENDVDVVHAHFGPDGLYAADAARTAGVPLAITLHGRDVTVKPARLIRSGRPIAVRYGLQRPRLGSKAAVLLCVSDQIRDTAVTAGIDPSRLRTHYIGVDTEEFAENTDPREPTVVHVARLVEKKGTAYLIQAFAAISGRFPDVRLIIVGDGTLRDALRRQADETGVGHRIVFRGRLPQSEVKSLVRNSSVFALPSVTARNGDREGLPIALVEAMALGSGVLATRHSGIPEALPSTDLGVLVPERDPAALERALGQMLDDPAGTRQMGANAARFARARFDLRTQTRVLENVYDELR